MSPEETSSGPERRGDSDKSQLLASSRQLRLALTAANVGAWEWDIATNRTYWSAENYGLLGLEPGSGRATYDEWMGCVHPDDRERTQRHVEKAIEQRGDLDFEYRAVWPDGSVHWLRDIGQMMLDENGEPFGMYGVQMDVTEQRLLEEDLRQSQRLEALGRIAGAVAHDFNNLLTVIRGYGGLLDATLSANPEARLMIEELDNAAARAARLTQQLLAFGQRQVLSPKVLNLNRVVSGLEDLMKGTLGVHIELALDLEDDLAPVKIDPAQLEQVLLTLTINARDSMPDGGRLRIKTSTVSLTEERVAGFALEPGEHLSISLTDSGHGIESRDLPHVFDPFPSAAHGDQDAGLGLASVHGIVAQSGGAIDVESVPGTGSTFTIYLPRADEAPDAGADAPEAELSVGDGGPQTILVVEDEDVIRKLLAASLEHKGFDIVTAASAEEAESLLSAGKPRIDLLLSDVVLPGVSGPELAKRVRAAFPDARVLFISGYGYDRIGHLGVLDPAIPLLHKPFTPTELVAKVRAVLTSR
ncbi:MAG: PAS domain-containing protein [Acidobacteriota bacterium]|nr:PAS domain-containing protein [Acidobacteriota bacterium]